MNESRSNRDPHDSQWDNNDPVWRLLGESPRPEPDAWFTVRTLARCRELSQAAETKARSSLGNLWRWALGGGLGVCLAVLLMVPRNPAAQPASSTDNQTKVQQAFAIMASIDASNSSDSDSDSDSSSSSTWQDSSSL